MESGVRAESRVQGGERAGGARGVGGVPGSRCEGRGAGGGQGGLTKGGRPGPRLAPAEPPGGGRLGGGRPLPFQVPSSCLVILEPLDGGREWSGREGV